MNPGRVVQVCFVQVSDDIQPELWRHILKLLPHGLDYHITLLPESAHEIAVHAEFPDILARRSLTIDCAKYSMSTVAKVLSVVSCQAMKIFHSLTLLNSYTAEDFEDATTSVKAFYSAFKRVLWNNLSELHISSPKNPCYATQFYPLRSLLEHLGKTGTLKKLSLISSSGFDAADMRAICNMARQFSRWAHKLPRSLRSLTLINSCHMTWDYAAEDLSNAILNLPQLTALHFDGGSPSDMTGNMFQYLDWMERRKTKNNEELLDNALKCVTALAGEAGITVEELRRSPPADRRIQNAILKSHGRVFVNLMQALSSAQHHCQPDARVPPFPCAEGLLHLCVDGYLETEAEVESFGVALSYCKNLQSLQLLPNSVPSSSSQKLSKTLCFANFATHALTMLTNLQSLQLVDASNGCPNRDWTMSSARDFHMLAAICSQQKLQRLSVAFECSKVSCKDLEQVWMCLAVTTLTSLDLKLLTCPAHTTQSILMPIPSLTRLKHLAVRAHWDSFPTAYRSPLVDLYKSKHLERLVLSSTARVAEGIGFLVYGLGSLQSLKYLEISGKYETPHVWDLHSQIRHCVSLQTVQLNEVCIGQNTETGPCTGSTLNMAHKTLQAKIEGQLQGLAKVLTDSCIKRATSEPSSSPFSSSFCELPFSASSCELHDDGSPGFSSTRNPSFDGEQETWTARERWRI